MRRSLPVRRLPCTIPGWTPRRRRTPRRGSRGTLKGVLAGADAAVVFAGHKEYRGLVPARVMGLCGCPWPVIVDGRNVVDRDAWIAGGFAYRGIGRGDKNGHALKE